MQSSFSSTLDREKNFMMFKYEVSFMMCCMGLETSLHAHKLNEARWRKMNNRIRKVLMRMCAHSGVQTWVPGPCGC